MAVRWPAKIKPDAPHGRSFIMSTTLSRRSTRYRRYAASHGERRRAGPDDGVSSPIRSTTEGQRTVTHPVFRNHGSRAIYHDEWIACVMGPRIPWVPGLPAGIREWSPDKDVWELYDLDRDRSQANDLAARMPERLAQMKDIFLIEAAKNKALPIGGASGSQFSIRSCASLRPTRSGPSPATWSGCRNFALRRSETSLTS